MKILSLALFVLLLYPFCSFGQVQNNGNLKMHSGANVAIFGNFTNDGTFTNNLGTLFVVGINPQIFNGTSLIQANNLTLNKASNSLQLDNVLQVSNVLTFTNGLLLSDHADIATEFVEFLDGATYVGASNTSHIDGVVRKTGNDVFVFPTGDNNLLRPVAISAPGSVTDHFTGYYFENDADALYSRSSLDVNIHHVSACEYWILNRTGGSSNSEITLSWGSNSCGVTDLCDLLVARWDGTKWTSEGNGGTTGSIGSGTVVSGAGCSLPVAVTNFSPFTLASVSGTNPLPIGLLTFEAKVCENSVCLDWVTVTEIENDYFTIEKSTDGLNWDGFKNVAGAGNSNSILTYKSMDESPYLGVSYYRLKQTDFNSDFMYSEIRAVDFFDNSKDLGLSIYPNPAISDVTIIGQPSEINQLKIYNSYGQEITSIVNFTRVSKSHLLIDISTLLPGVYFVNTTNNNGLIVKQ